MIACYGMGLTQHRSGVLAIQMLSNLLLLRGNIGKPGAGIFPVRGHSNVQGQRPSASPRSRNSCRSIDLPSSTVSIRRA